MDRSKQIETLNDLIAKNYDSEKGYKEAAEEVDNHKLKALFQDYAKQRYDFGHEIKDCIRKLGGEIEKGDTIASKLHRAWIDIRSALTSDDDASVLKEVKRGEENAIETYNEALEDLEPQSEAYKVVTDQRNKIRTALNRVEQMIPVFDD